MPCTYKEFPETKTVEIGVEGRVTQEDFDHIMPKIKAFIETHGTVKLIEIIKDFSGFDASVLWPGIKFDFKHIKDFSHVAVVSDIGWMSPLSKAAGTFMSTKIRTFSMDELDRAKEWIEAA